MQTTGEKLGFYWVKVIGNDGWTIAEIYSPNKLWIPGCAMSFTESEVQFGDKIERVPPDSEEHF